MYDYLVRARRDLWAALKAVPDGVISKNLLNGERFKCIKDLVFHIADVEDGWTRGTIQRVDMVQRRFVALWEGGPSFAAFPLETLLSYWRAVETSTLQYLPTLSAEELNRTVEDSPEDHFQLEGLLWHVILHEVRHTAQICALLRTQGIKPPALDLLWYLPKR
jgi:uncharacterized damage-inducible protein DinB